MDANSQFACEPSWRLRLKSPPEAWPVPLEESSSIALCRLCLVPNRLVGGHVRIMARALPAGPAVWHNGGLRNARLAHVPTEACPRACPEGGCRFAVKN